MEKLKLQIEDLINESASDSLKIISLLNLKSTFSTSFGKEDQVITNIISKNNLDISVFTLDTVECSMKHMKFTKTLEQNIKT